MKISKNPLFSLFSRIWVYVIFTFVSLIFFYPIFQNKIPLPGDFVLGVYEPWISHKWPGYPAGVPVKNPIMADVVSFTYPMQTYALELLKSGTAPFWNPYILAGTPLLANFQSAPFAPTNAAAYFLNIRSGWTVKIILQHFLTMIFMFAMLRSFKVSKYASLLGGVVFAFSGFNTIWSQWSAHALTASFIPLSIFAINKYFEKKIKIWGVLLAFSIALQILSGYPQVVIYSLFIFGLFTLVKTIETKNYKLTFFVGFFCVLGVLLASIQLFPGFELLVNSQRSVEAHPYEWAFLPYEKIITIVAPDFFGNHSTGNWWGPQDYTSNTLFVGVTPLLLSLVFIFQHFKLLKNYYYKQKTHDFVAKIIHIISSQFTKDKSIFLFLITTLVFSLLLSFPTILSIFLWKSGFLGFQAASAHRALVIANFSLAALAAFGLDNIIKNNKGIKLPFALVISLLFIFLLYALTREATYERLVAIRNLILPFLALTFFVIIIKFSSLYPKIAYLLIPLSFFELFMFFHKFTPFTNNELVFPKTPILEKLSEHSSTRSTGSHVIPINLRMNYKIASLEGYDAVYPKEISSYLNRINYPLGNVKLLGRYGFVDNLDSQLLDIASVNYFISKKNDNFFERNPRFTKIQIEGENLELYKNNYALPRFSLFDNWQIVDDDKSLEVISQDKFNYKKTVILDRNPAIAYSLLPLEYSVKKNFDSGNEIVLEVHSNKDAILYISDSYFPGWRVTVNKVEKELMKANYLFRAVPVPKGDSIVRFYYLPESFVFGLKVSVLVLFFLITIFMFSLFKKES